MMALGDIVSALRAAHGWTLQELAARVRRAGAANVRHQNIQQLESKPHTRPRYLIELASAFGKSVEDLRTWTPGDPILGHNHNHNHNHGVAEPASLYDAPEISSDELELLDDYRACAPNARAAIRVLASASRTESKPRRITSGH